MLVCEIEDATYHSETPSRETIELDRERQFEAIREVRRKITTIRPPVTIRPLRGFSVSPVLQA